jgi:hypothetical protein
MIRKLVGPLGLALLVLLVSVSTSGAQTTLSVGVSTPGAQIDLSYFYQNLSSDGDWFQDPTRGWCWTPYDMTADWRPYSDGNWEYTDYGWSWASNEPFGWATYHYGRWFFDDSYGWAWVPGTEWAPAWVAWRSNDDYVGWAPLPPGADWDDTRGLNYANANQIPSDQWCFVPQANVLDVNVSLQFVPLGRNVTLFAESRDATRYEVRGGRPADVGFDVTRVEARMGHAVARVQIQDVDAPARGNGRAADASGRADYFRPRVQRAPVAQAPGAEITGRGNTIADVDLQRTRVAGQARLDVDLNAQHARLVSEQDRELRAQSPGPGADAVRKRQVVEQQAFTAHAAQQRQVFTQRMQKRVVRPGRPAAATPNLDNKTTPGNGNGQGKGNAQGNGNGNGNGPNKDKGRDKGGN